MIIQGECKETWLLWAEQSAVSKPCLSWTPPQWDLQLWKISQTEIAGYFCCCFADKYPFPCVIHLGCDEHHLLCCASCLFSDVSMLAHQAKLHTKPGAHTGTWRCSSCDLEPHTCPAWWCFGFLTWVKLSALWNKILLLNYLLVAIAAMLYKCKENLQSACKTQLTIALHSRQRNLKSCVGFWRQTRKKKKKNKNKESDEKNEGLLLQQFRGVGIEWC